MADEGGKKNPGNRFRKGQSGNPKGRARRDQTIDQFYEGLFETVDGPIERREAILKRLFTSAMDTKRKDHAKLLELAVAYYYGKPRERVEMSGPGGGPMQNEDVAPKRATTGELRKRLDALLDKRGKYLAKKAAANGQGSGEAEAAATNGVNHDEDEQAS